MNSEPAVGIEPTTARLRIGCSTTELRWRTVEVNRRTCPGADSNRDAFRHHPLKMACLPVSPPGRCTTVSSLVSACVDEDDTPTHAPIHQLTDPTGPTGLEPATSRVTVECSNQTELR